MNMENFTSVFNSADGPTSIFVAGKTPEIMGVLIAIVVVGVIISLFGETCKSTFGDDGTWKRSSDRSSDRNSGRS